MFIHNKNLRKDDEEIQTGLEKIIERAKLYNKLYYDSISVFNSKEAKKYAEIRDSYLNCYFMITGVVVDYGGL